MNDSTAASAVQATFAGISSVTMALFGLQYLALLWAFIGAIAILVFTVPENKGRTLVTIAFSGLIGAAAGTAAARFIGGAEAAQHAACLLFGAGAKPILSTAIEALQARIRRAGDGQ